MLEVGAQYETRLGRPVLLTHEAVIPWSYNGTRQEWRGVSGIFLDNGERCTWETDGAYAPGRHEHEYDLEKVT